MQTVTHIPASRTIVSPKNCGASSQTGSLPGGPGYGSKQSVSPCRVVWTACRLTTSAFEKPTNSCRPGWMHCSRNRCAMQGAACCTTCVPHLRHGLQQPAGVLQPHSHRVSEMSEVALGQGLGSCSGSSCKGMSHSAGRTRYCRSVTAAEAWCKEQLCCNRGCVRQLPRCGV